MLEMKQAQKKGELCQKVIQNCQGCWPDSERQHEVPNLINSNAPDLFITKNIVACI